VDYNRIYGEFILDRAGNSRPVDSYTERHHIIPKSLGGTNVNSNIVRLTPEDHLFAHLLLAKIHNGKMWLAVKAMLDFESYEKRRHKTIGNLNRHKFGFIRREIAKSYSEMYTGKSKDKKRYLIHHKNGSELFGLRSHIVKNSELNKSKLSAILTGKSASHEGWFYKRYNPKGLIGSGAHSKEKRQRAKEYTFYHYNEDVFTGTVWDLEKYSGDKITSINSLIAGRSDYLLSGYALNLKDSDRSRVHRNESQKLATNARGVSGNITGLNNPNVDLTIYHLHNIRSNESFNGYRVDFCKMVGVKSKQISRLFNGGIWHDWVSIELIDSEKVKKYKRYYSIHTLFNPSINHKISGTSSQLAKRLDVSIGTISGLISGNANTSKGYAFYGSKF